MPSTTPSPPLGLGVVEFLPMVSVVANGGAMGRSTKQQQERGSADAEALDPVAVEGCDLSLFQVLPD